MIGAAGPMHARSHRRPGSSRKMRGELAASNRSGFYLTVKQLGSGNLLLLEASEMKRRTFIKNLGGAALVRSPIACGQV
jgi:hypothetical protein